MSPELTAVLAAAQSLPLDERRELAERILDDLNGDGAPLSKEEWLGAWLPELRRRREEDLNGKSKSYPLDEVLAEIRKELR